MTTSLETRTQATEQTIGAGDQGLMYGYATDETASLLPPSIYYAHLLAERLSFVREKGIVPFLYPDGKTQVTVMIDDRGEFIGISNIIVSTQHFASASLADVQTAIFKEVIEPVIAENIRQEAVVLINPSGSFVKGGPAADTGLTGRKIIVDTYGGVIPHGGGAFSGKDATKVDRSAAYMARYVAKQVVAAKLARKCQVSLAYAIGKAEPTAIVIDTFGTSKVAESLIESAIGILFDFTPQGIIDELALRRPIYQATSCYGHFKASKNNLPWEQITGKSEQLRGLLGL